MNTIITALIFYCLVPAIYSKPDVMITDENGVEIIYGVLIPNKQYKISVRDQAWDENYEILHMTYHSRTNTWIKSPVKLKRQFQQKITDQQRVTPMLISVIQVVKKINKTKIAYSSSIFTLSHQNDMRKMCQNWIKQDKKITKNLNNFFPCPCTLKEAEVDPNYEYDIMCTLQETHPFWDSLNCQTKKAAYGCFISKPMM